MRRTWAAVIAAAVATTALAACTGDDPEPPDQAAAAPIAPLAAAWAERDLTAFGDLTDDAAAAAKALRRLDEDLGLGLTTVTPQGEPDCDESGCTQSLEVEAQVNGIGTWTYGTTATTVRVADAWKVAWSPSLLHPDLTADTALQRTREVPARAQILDRQGRELTSNRRVYRIGVVPAETKPGSYDALAALLDVDGPALRQRAKAAEPEWFVDVITLRSSDYAPVRSELLRVPGVAVDPGRLPLAPTSSWGRAVLGTVGPATAETMQYAGPLMLDTDMVGASGLQAAYEEQLAGTPGGTVALVDRRTGEQREVLWRARPVEGQPLRTTLDYRFQDAAEQALAGQTKTTVLVAVDARTGEVLADANGPDVTSYNTGFVGQYPPGSTFKVVSSAALLTGGQDLEEQVACPSTTVVDGKRFKNYEFTSLSAGTTFADALAASCNTTVVGLADTLDNAALSRTAQDLFGIGAEWDLPLEAYSGSVPRAASLVDRAASMIGQGRVLMSPLSLAMVAATVASGQARSPALVPDQGGQPVADPLPGQLADDLRTIMRLVVTEGTATSLRGLSGDIGAKTGTAEIGSADPPSTHGWLIGFRDDVAFACLVVKGAGGNSDAGPVVRRFLELAPRAVPL